MVLPKRQHNTLLFVLFEALKQKSEEQRKVRDLASLFKKNKKKKQKKKPKSLPPSSVGDFVTCLYKLT